MGIREGPEVYPWRSSGFFDGAVRDEGGQDTKIPLAEGSQ